MFCYSILQHNLRNTLRADMPCGVVPKSTSGKCGLNAHRSLYDLPEPRLTWPCTLPDGIDQFPDSREMMIVVFGDKNKSSTSRIGVFKVGEE